MLDQLPTRGPENSFENHAFPPLQGLARLVCAKPILLSLSRLTTLFLGSAFVLRTVSRKTETIDLAVRMKFYLVGYNR